VTPHCRLAWLVVNYLTQVRDRWAVQGNGKQRTFIFAMLAESFRSTLLVASSAEQGFDVESGLPPTLMPKMDPNTWFNHALAYT
jgi:hypothetical protein